jgi:hypothetical protein
VITADEKAKLQSMSESEKENYKNELKAKYNISSE